MNAGIFGQGQFDQCVAFLFAKNNADSRLFCSLLHVTVKVIDVHLHLPKVLMSYLANLQINQDITAQQTIIENEINEEVILIEGEAFLPGLKQKAFAQFQKKMFPFVYDG